MLEFLGKLVENLNQFIDLLKSNLLTISVSVALYSGALLILPESIFTKFHIAELRNNYISTIGLVAFTSLFVAILLISYRILVLAYLFVRGYYFELTRLTPVECEKLGQFIHNTSLTATFFTTDGVPYLLQDKGLIYQSKSDPVSMHSEQDFHMYRWIYSKLLKHPEIIKQETDDEK